MDLRELDQRAMNVTAAIVNGVTAGQLAAPTPCGRWQVGDLLAHIVGQYHGFALAASGEPVALAEFEPRSIGGDPAAAYAEAAAGVSAAFAAEGVLDRKFHLPEIAGGGPFPARMAIGFHLVDEVVHAWDLAVSVGATAAFDDEVLDAALVIAGRVPSDPATRGDGFAFALGSEPDPAAPKLDKILILLGRDPGWAPPA